MRGMPPGNGPLADRRLIPAPVLAARDAPAAAPAPCAAVPTAVAPDAPAAPALAAVAPAATGTASPAVAAVAAIVPVARAAWAMGAVKPTRSPADILGDPLKSPAINFGELQQIEAKMQALAAAPHAATTPAGLKGADVTSDIHSLKRSNAQIQEIVQSP